MVEGIPFLDNDSEIGCIDGQEISIAHETPAWSSQLVALGIHDRYGVHVDEPGLGRYAETGD